VFTNVILKTCSLAKAFKQTPNQQYMILLIVTDGTINDMVR
jgi:hypothetical protein